LVNERFGSPVLSSILRFLHLPRTGTSVPNTSTSTAAEIKSHTDPRLLVRVAGGAVVAAAGELTVSEDGFSVAAGGAESGADALTFSELELTGAAGAIVVAAFLSGSLRR
jgi:hypothetical protein